MRSGKSSGVITVAVLGYALGMALVAVAVAGAIITLFWVSGFEVPLPHSRRSALGNGARVGKTLRVVADNTDRSVTLTKRVDTDLLVWDADIVVMQDCVPEVGAAMMAADTRYHVFLESEFCIASRLPMRSPVQPHGTRKEGRAARERRSARGECAAAGRGLGHTMFAGRHRVRIDHVLVSREFTVTGARVLSGFPSEHQPVVVELSLVP